MITRNFIRTETLKSLYEFIIQSTIFFEDFLIIIKSDKKTLPYPKFIDLIKKDDFSKFRDYDMNSLLKIKFEFEKLEHKIKSNFIKKESAMLENARLLIDILVIFSKIIESDHRLKNAKNSIYELISNNKFITKLKIISKKSEDSSLDLEEAIKDLYFNEFKNSEILNETHTNTTKYDELTICSYIIKKIAFKSAYVRDFFLKNDYLWYNTQHTIYNLIMDYMSKSDKNSPFAPVTTSEQKKFYANLISNVINNWSYFNDFIENNSKNWDIERVFYIDKIIILMALNEFAFMDTPKNVIINEYVNIAKTFSSPKSKIFINGILETICNQLVKSENLKTDVQNQKLFS